MIKKACYPLLVLALLAGCAVPTEIGGTTAIPSSTQTAETPISTVPIAPPPETIVAPTLAPTVPNPTSIPDTRLPPERWQEWPIVPSVTQKAIEIYRRGWTMNLDPHAFSKVGDCQSIREAFMGYFDIPERYLLGEDYAFLQGTIDNFRGHFNTNGQAVKGGFNAAAVLSPLWADPKVCLSGENPLECELRVTKPIIMIVNLEVWWDGRTPEQYETLMRRILDTIIAHGAVPILATKADNVEGDHSLNLTTARLAYEYDLPLWNFWAAVQPLPAHGMDTNRNDGFHISTQAWSTRSFTGLEALDSVWHGLLKAAPAEVATQAVGATATPLALVTSVQNPVTTSAPTPAALPAGIQGQIVFGLSERQGDGYAYPGVYLLDLAAQTTRQVFGTGVRFQSASPDGKYLLVSEGSTLYRTRVDGTAPLRLMDSLYALGNTDAVWLSDNLIAVLSFKNGETGISILAEGGELVSEIPVPGASPVELNPGSNSSFIYWESGSCTGPGVCQRNGQWVTGLDGMLNQELPGLQGSALSPNGRLLVSGTASSTEQNTLVFSAQDGSNPRSYPLPGNLLVDYAWSPGGDGLAAILTNRDNYSGKVLGNRNFLVDPLTLGVSEYPPSSLLNPRVLWSPDGSNLVFLGTLPFDGGFMIGASLVNRNSKQAIDISAAMGQSTPGYLAVANAEWLPVP
jgi:hypothetical protein